MLQSSALMEQKRLDAETPQLMTNVTSLRPSLASGSFASVAKAEQPTNPSYMSKPNRAMSDNDLYDGQSSSSNNCDAPLSPKAGEKPEADDESIDGDIKTHSGSVSSNKNPESDYHHIVESVTHERDRKQKEYRDSNGKHAGQINEAIASKNSISKLYKDSSKTFDSPEFNLQTPNQEVSPKTKNVTQMKQPKLISNAHKLSTLHMFQYPEHFEPNDSQHEAGPCSPQFA